MCPFCAERIQAAAIKCRYCGEFLNTERAKAVEEAGAAEADNEEESSAILYEGSPSLWGIAGSAIKGGFFFVLAIFLVFYPVEGTRLLNLSDGQAIVFSQYRIIGGIAIAVAVVVLLFLKVLNLKMIRYEVSSDRIEWSRGIFDRQVDNMDMFRVVDLKLRRSLLDCILGIGTISLITTDKTDPEFNFEKLRRPRELYDVIKEASLDADHRQRVIHLE